MRSTKSWISLAFISILSGALLVGFGIGMGGVYHDGYGIYFGMEETGEFTIPLDEFHELDIDLEYGDISVQSGEDWGMVVENISEDDYQYHQKDGVLSVKTSYDAKFSIINWEAFSSAPRITITIPKNSQLTKATVVSALGDVELEDMNCDHVEVEQAMGDISLTDVRSESITLDQSMGDVIYDGEHPGNMKISNAMGDIEVNIDDEMDSYRYECKTAMGSIKADGHKESGASAHISAGAYDAPYQLILENDMGDITLEFDDAWD